MIIKEIWEVCQITDIHCHILPGVDDGSDSLQESILMCESAYSSGVGAIIATPHFDAGIADTGRWQAVISERLSSLKAALLQSSIPVDIYSGGEVLVTPELIEPISAGSVPFLADSDYMLAEFYFDESLFEIDDMLHRIASFGIHPVIAHPERYFAVQQNRDAIVRWFHSGYVIQINKGSIMGRLGRGAHSTARWILKHGLAHIAASDAHGSNVRTPELSSLRELLETEYSDAYADILLNRNPRRILQNRPMVDA